ncbi:MAG: T9SS type A sorting domain-containing protein [Ignavibacteria bacterium]|nr:T9SS type A sorting domain-containing protein [Ignavibacteria bacterium]
MRQFSILVLALALTMVFFRDSISQVKTQSLTEGKGYRLYPSAAVSMMDRKQDGTIICWIDMSHGGSLYAQKILADGRESWARGGVIADKDLGSEFSAGDDYPMVFTDGSGGCMVIYRKDDEICMMRISAHGIPDRDPAILSSYYGGINLAPKAVQSGELSVAVMWENFTEGNFDIHGQLISRHGEMLWQNGHEVQIVRHQDDQRKPELIFTGSREIICTWLDTRNISFADSGSYDVYAALLNNEGNHLGNSTGESIHRQYFPPMCEKTVEYSHRPVRTGAHFYITPENRIVEGAGDVQIKCFSSKFELIWQTELRADGIYENPNALADETGGVLVYWNEKSEGISMVKAKRFTATGKPYDGGTFPIEISCRVSKSDNSRSVIGLNGNSLPDRHTGTFHIPIIKEKGGHLQIHEISLTDESGNCGNMQTVNQGLAPEGHTAMAMQGGNLVIAYNLAQDIFVSIRELPVEEAHNKSSDVSIANFPNPFNPVTSIYFEVPTAGFVRLSVYDTGGRLLKELVNGHRSAGRHKAEFNGGGLSSGVYYYRLETGKGSMVGKMVMVK